MAREHSLAVWLFQANLDFSEDWRKVHEIKTFHHLTVRWNHLILHVLVACISTLASG